MGPRIKICGISKRHALEAAIQFGADMVGFIHYPPSPRHIELDKAAQLRALLPLQIKTVAVGVDMEDELLQELRNRLQPDFFQLHGSESPYRVKEIRARFKVGVIKAIRVQNGEDIARAENYRSTADLMLFDAHGEALPGGNGIVFDWTLLRQRKETGEWILSGGLTPETVIDAIRRTGAPIVDVSSGVESEPGKKDPKRIQQFLLAARTEMKVEAQP